mgnify:CR=1 FL=1
MRVMYILHESGDSFNGASRSALTLIQEAAKDNDRVYVVLPKKMGRLFDELKRLKHVEIIEATYYRWKKRKAKNFVKSFIRYIKYRFYESIVNRVTARKLGMYALKEKVDVIHTNSSVINLGGLIHKVTKIPHVWHIREFGEEDFDMYPMESKHYFYDFIYNNSNFVLCISEAIGNKLRKNMPGDKIKVIYNGIHIPPLCDKQHFSNNLLISGVISKKKGQWIAVEAVRLLKEKGIVADLYIAGKGDEQSLNITPDIASHIHVLGFIDDMAMLRSNMDVELMCSVSEGFGRTTVEAMASGLLTVAAAGGASPEIVREGENGFLFDVNDPVSLSEVLRKILLYSDTRKIEIRKSAYEDVRKRFNRELYVNEVKKLYYELLDSHRKV